MPQRGKTESAVEHGLRARIAALEAALARAQSERDAAREFAALREVAAGHRHELDGLPDAVFVHDDERVVYVNEATVRLLGARSKAELIGRPALYALPPDEAALQLSRRRKVLAERCTLPLVERQRRRLDGTPIWIECHGGFTLWDGKPAYLGVLRDITARKQAEAQHRHVLDMLPDAVFVHVDETVVFVNEAAVHLLGAACKDDLLGRPSLSHVTPAFLEVQRARRREVMTQHRTLPLIEQKRRRLDGTEIWVETKATYTLWEGKPAFLGTARDITTRKEAEFALEEASTRLEAITQNLPGAVYQRVLDRDGRIRFPYVSSGIAEISGLEAGHVMADPAVLLDLVAPEFRAAYREKLADSAARLAPLDIEIPVTGKDGAPRWIRSQGRPRRRADGAVVWDGLMIDITAQRQVEQRAHQLHDWLLGAIESMPNGFMLWDADDRLVLWNGHIARVYPGAPALLKAGATYDDVTRGACEAVRRHFGSERAEAWLQQRNRLHREGTGAFQFEGRGDRWFVMTERRTPDGFTVTIVTETTERKRNEDRLGESEGRYRALLEQLPDAVLIHIDGRFVFVNAAAVRILGAESKEQLIGRDALCIVPPEYHAVQLARRQAMLSEQRPAPLLEQRRRRLDGTLIWAENTAVPIRWEGKPAILGVVRDITEKKRAQEHAQELNHWLRGAVESMPEGFMLWDPEDRLVMWNQQVLRFFPHGERLAEGMTFESLIQGTADAIRRRRGDDAALLWLEKRRMQRRESAGAYEFKGRDGVSFVVAERRTPEGFTVTLVTDVTEHRQNEERLRESEERHRALIDLSPDAIYVHRRGRIVLCNEAAVAMFGGPDADALLGRSTLDLIHPDLHDFVRERQSLAAAAGTRTTYMRQRRLRIDGTSFWAEVAAAVVDWQGARGGIVIVRDVTGQMQAEDALRRSKESAEIANRAKTEFLANISHELRTPLNAIIGFSDVMQREMFGPLGADQYRAYARDIHQSGTHLHEMINDILDLSKIEAGKLDLREEVVDVETILGRCIRLLRPRAEEGGIALETRIAPRLPQLHADARKLKQVIINLLSNAVKFSHPGGTVTVEARLEDGGGLALAVVDTGIGMSPEDIPIALQPFGQLDSALDRKYEGTGLGLPLARSLVELHGGTFLVESARGEGTRVTVRLPSERVIAASGAE